MCGCGSKATPELRAEAAALLPETPADPVIETMIRLGLLPCTVEQFRRCVHELASRGHLPHGYVVSVCLTKCITGHGESQEAAAPLDREEAALVTSVLAGVTVQELVGVLATVPGFNCTIQQLRDCVAEMMAAGTPAVTAMSLCLAQCLMPRPPGTQADAATVDVEEAYRMFANVPGFHCTLEELRTCVRDAMARGVPARTAMALCLAQCVMPRPGGGGATVSGGTSTPATTTPPTPRRGPCSVEVFLDSISIANRDNTGNEWQFTFTVNGQRWTSPADVSFPENNGAASSRLGAPVLLATVTQEGKCGDTVEIPIRFKAEQFDGRNDRARVWRTFTVTCPTSRDVTTTFVAHVHDNSNERNPSSTVTATLRFRATCT